MDPTIVPAASVWRQTLGGSRRPYPVCPKGHVLRSRLLGNLTEVPLALAFLQGVSACSAAFLLAVLRDLRHPAAYKTDLCLKMMTAMSLVAGLIAFGYTWDWAGRTGPVHKLATRACGVAFGYLVPSAIAVHALYLEWAHALEDACLARFAQLLTK